jgi:hypothetical protein
VAPGFDQLPPHRRLVGFLDAALDCLEEAVRLDDTCGVLPHWARGQLRTMTEELAELFAPLAREAPLLGPLHEEEVRDEDAEEG